MNEYNHDQENRDESEQENLDAELHQLQQNIGSYLLSTSNEAGLEHEARSFRFDKSKKKGTKGIRLSKTSIANSTFSKAFEGHLDSSDESNHQSIDEPVPSRYQTSVKILLESVMQSRESDQRDTTNQSIVNVDGSYKSIIQFGKNEGLDEQQQIAFQIMTAAYVLTFYDEATDRELINDEFTRNINGLKLLSRQRGETPSRLFVTGPAGAGKCT